MLKAEEIPKPAAPIVFHGWWFPPSIPVCRPLSLSFSRCRTQHNWLSTGEKNKRQSSKRNKNKKKITSIKRSGSVQFLFILSLYLSPIFPCNILYTIHTLLTLSVCLSFFILFLPPPPFWCNGIITIISFQMDLTRSVVVMPVCI